MHRVVILILILHLTFGCISPKKYHVLQKQNEKLLKKNRMLVRKTDSLFEANNAILNQMTILQNAYDSLLSVHKPITINKQKKTEVAPSVKESKKPDFKQWSDAKYLKANTAKDAAYLSKEEKEFIRLINLCRMNPNLFLDTYLADIKKKTRANMTKYEASLIEYLSNEAPKAVFVPDLELYQGAFCHAKNSGMAGYVGHVRSVYSPSCSSGYFAECCSYGSFEAFEHLINLLVDEGVESLGHRLILMGGYKTVGVSLQPHKTYGTNIVIDLR
jgi:hypothetical protein